jgi:hypothetical protein
MDADDTVVGAPDFGRLAPTYMMRIRDSFTSRTYWRRQLFRDGVRWHYWGVVHEYAHCDDPFIEERPPVSTTSSRVARRPKPRSAEIRATATCCFRGGTQS